MGLGAITTTLTKNPLPLAAATVNCLMAPAAAQTSVVNDIEALIQKKEFSQALQHTRLAISTPTEIKDPAKLLYLEGLCLKRLGNIKEALELFRKASEINPSYQNDREFTELEDVVRNPAELITYRQEFLAQIGMDVPNHQEYMLICALVNDHQYYNDVGCHEDIPSDTPCQEASGTSLLSKQLEEKNWKQHKKSPIPKAGYAAVSFKNEKSKHIIIVHQAIDNAKEFEVHLSRAINFTERLGKENQDYTISHTGAFYGARFAEVLAYRRHEVVVTLDSPGSKLYILNKFNKQVEEGWKSPLSVVYLTDPTPVNTEEAHIGERLYLVNSANFISSNPLCDYVSGIPYLYTCPKKYGSSVLGGSDSSEVILEHFDSEKGGAKNYQTVIRWPQGKSEQTRYHDPNFQSRDSIFKVTSVVENSALLSDFSEEVQQLLISCHRGENSYLNLSRHFLMLYEIRGNDVILHCDPELLSIQDFKNYIHHKIVTIRNKSLVVESANPLEHWNKKNGRLKPPSQEYEIFFGLPCIKKLPLVKIEALKTALNKADRSSFDNIINEVGGESLISILERELIDGNHTYPGLRKDSRNVFDFETLIGQLFNKHHVNTQSFMYLMSRDPQVAVGKLLEINDQGVSLLSGEIEWVNRTNSAIHLKLTNQCRAHVEIGSERSGHHIYLTKRHRIQLIGYLDKLMHEPVIPVEFELEFDPDGHFEWLAEGRYQMEKINPFTEENTVTTLRLYGLDNNLSFELEFSYEQNELNPSHYHLYQMIAGERKEKLDLGIRGRYLYAAYMGTDRIPISFDQIDQQVFIRAFAFNRRAQKYEVIQKEIRLLSQMLSEERFESLVDSALTHLIEKQFKEFTNTRIIEKTPIYKKLQRIAALYSDPEIEKNISIEEIFRNILLEFNYHKLAAKAGVFDASEVLKLCTLSQQYIDSLKGQNIIVVVGDTGSGKSTSICILQGGSVTKLQNEFHQEVYDCSHPNGITTPKIGMSISTSETAFTQGFSVPDLDRNLTFCDTPGFMDTRGENYELCAAFGIDQAIHRAKSIRAVVVVVPYSVFSSSKGVLLEELFRNLDKRIPRLIQDWKSVHLLVTKHGSHGDQDLEKTIDSYFQATQSEKAMSGRKKIWEVVKNMHRQGHIKRIDPKNKANRIDLVKRYAASSGLNKNDFPTLMQAEGMKAKFAGKIESAAATWTDEIIQRFLVKIDEVIAATEKEILSLQVIVSEIKQGLLKNQEVLAEYENNLKNMKIRSEDLNKLKNQPENFTTMILHTKEIYKERQNSIQSEVTRLNNSIILKKQKIEKTDILIYSINVIFNDIVSKNETVYKDFIDIREGYEPKELLNLSWKPNQIIKFCNRKHESNERMIQEKRGSLMEDCLNGVYDQQTLASEYTGEFQHGMEIEREYWIAPPPGQEALQKEFAERGTQPMGSAATNLSQKAITMNLTSLPQCMQMQPKSSIIS